MKKNFLETAQNAFVKTGAAQYMLPDQITTSLNKLLLSYAGSLKKEPTLSFGQFCENLGNNIVSRAEPPEMQLIRARILCYQNSLK